MTLADLTAKMKEGASKKTAFGNTVKFATDQGVVYIDGTQTPPIVSNDDKAADCTLKMDFGDFSDLIGGKLDAGEEVFIGGAHPPGGVVGIADPAQCHRLPFGIASLLRIFECGFLIGQASGDVRAREP